ncbi:MAG: 16S rRNA (guanine(527)-N(7))-methyltransferase RsmG [Deltaproteobacteria bacterium]|nr:16S rRNA (guanine(527)-N(7))-methyltransferase RsmG [Deltaproteobacteria bacterium]
MKNGLEDILRDGAAQLGITLTEEAIERFFIYLTELKKWNQKINLTSIESDRDILIRHFLDSMTIYPFVRGSKTVLDMGAGAGFPGIPLKIIAPTLEVTLVDSVAKKVSFMRHIIRTLGPAPDNTGIHALHSRIEDPAFIEGYKGYFDCIISRAFSALDLFVGLALPICATGGRIIAMKGPNTGEELKGMANVNVVSPAIVHEVSLPFSDRRTTIIVFEKQAE